MDEYRLFEKICLEGFQSGLSWLTILLKRPRFREVFADFDYRAVAEFGTHDVERLLDDAGIIRHRGKIEATINNAQRAVELVRELLELPHALRRKPVPACVSEASATCERRVRGAASVVGG